FRTHTKKAVEAYQRDNNLIVTGIVGKVTGDKIYEESCGEERGLGDY
ncbi:MAG: peptidoglycan-binding protein, partial [Candidatus Pacebacteria bacterium]|nr:peptidoglycan-binding protein [Candidatus Paceibacterota bacterium]